MNVVFNLKDVHIIGKNNIVKIVKEVKYANIIVENIVVKNVVIDLNFAHIINKNLNVMNAVVLQFVLINV
tara:strand:- start:3140 stop:3349 length:210 start_codon:yes stop_codon:yes gene_type:complete